MEHYQANGFLGADGGLKGNFVRVYLGTFDTYIPNCRKRKKLIPYHDLHHILTGYAHSRIGEGEVSSWELGTGCLSTPLAALFNLYGLSTGLLYSPKRMHAAFLVGRQSCNLYKMDFLKLMDTDIEKIASERLMHRKDHLTFFSNALFFSYCCASLLLLASTLIPICLFGNILKDKYHSPQ